jgi:hypothetical protein
MRAPVPVRTTMAIGNLRSTILNRAILQIINTGHQAQYTGTPGPHKPMALGLPPLGKLPTVWYFLLTRVPLTSNRKFPNIYLPSISYPDLTFGTAHSTSQQGTFSYLKNAHTNIIKSYSTAALNFKIRAIGFLGHP